MKKYTQDELTEILAKHEKWLNDEEGGECANLSNTDLSHARLRYSNLSYANLSSANLRYSDLSHANLSYADLSYTYLRYSNLSYADLGYANLRHANLRDANLSSANLSHTSLNYTIGEMRSLRSMQIEKYMVSYTDTTLSIGCKSYTIEEWKNFDDEKIKSMDNEALVWWKKWKPIIMQIIEMAPAEPTRYIEKEKA